MLSKNVESKKKIVEQESQFFCETSIISAKNFLIFLKNEIKSFKNLKAF